VATLKEIIKGCKNFDHRYQKNFYEKYFGYALKIVFRYIYRYDRAIDVTNDGFVKVFKGFEVFEFKNDADLQKILMGWMRRIMVNTAIDELRKHNMMPEIGGLPDYIWEEPDRNGAADQIVLYKELITEIKKLPPSYRAVFNMYVIDGFTHQEIAEKLGISVGTSKSSLSKARMHLQKYINRNSSEADICNM
jgi:RNA polymerase sigma factor (sigma-70 family)